MIRQGVETGTTEIAASSDTGAKITSGGGFSRYFTQPSYQKDFIDAYFINAAKAGQTPVSGYSATGRGLPDVSLAGSYYAVYIGGTLTILSGTSASAPVMAGMLSNINAARIAAGKGPVGWANPAMYANSAQFVNDITSGNNKCAALNSERVVNCCTQGYYATTGWDPVTGLGSINYGKMETAFLSLGDVNAVTAAPTQAPVKPSSKPSREPTDAPTKSPIPRPGSPTASPSSSSRSPLKSLSGSPTAFPSTTAPQRSPLTPSKSPVASAPGPSTMAPQRAPLTPSKSPVASASGPSTTAPQKSPLSLSPSPSRSSNDEPTEVPNLLPSSSSPTSPIQGLAQTGDSNREYQCES